MTSVGVMASSHVAPASVDVLMEKFNDFTTAPWTNTTGWTIVAGRTGTAADGVGVPTTVQLHYTIPSAQESATLTLGFAYKCGNLAGTEAILRLDSDAGATTHIWVDSTSAGVIEVRNSGAVGPILASTPSGQVATGTWVYLELQIVLNDTTGSVIVRVNGAQQATATNVDTRNAGTKTTFDTVTLLGPQSGVHNQFDDLYLTMGPGAVFKGPITIP